jgi:GT2 family glycosyltransferase
LYKVFKDHKQVRLFLSTTNRGVAGGRELAFRHVRGDVVVSLDSDVLFGKENTLERLVSLVDPPQIGIAGVSGHFVLPDWSWYQEVLPNYVGEVDVVSGFCQVFRSEMLSKASLDQYYNPYWHEDSDFCLQIREQGYKVWCDSSIRVVHIFSGSGDDGQGRKKQRYLANKFKGKGLIAAENVPKVR